MSDLKQMIGMFLDDCPDASYEDILTACGSPTDVAADLLSNVPEQELRQAASRRKHILVSLIAGLLVITLCACAGTMFFYWQRENNPHEIQTIIYENESQIPAQTRNGLTYGLSYQLDKNGNILAAYDHDGNKVPVDAYGVPQEEQS